MHGLHQQQYAFLMLQVQMALVIKLFSGKINPLITYSAFSILGFIQGWMSFDFAFLATLFVIPFYILLRKEYFVSFWKLVFIGLASGLSFTLSHVLHFYQVVAYLGSFDNAWNDLFGAAKFRANNSISFGYAAHPKFTDEIGPFTVAKDFLYRVAGRGKYLSINLINFIWILLGLKFVKKITFKKGQTFEFSITAEDLFALAASILISSMWSLVMKQHAHIHGFIARHYFFCYFFCCLILVRRTRRIDISNEN
jgi:hypothetical protein